MADPKTLEERVAAEAARQGLDRAAAAVAGAAEGALDAVEKLLFGKVGGADEALAHEGDTDALDRLRARYGTVETPAAPPAEDPVEVARRQLAELKKARAAGKEPPATEEPPKRRL